MTWLTPLGFLGLIGLIILIIIYIIKPNYQQKFISTTFVWKLSLKFRKKRLPISKLRNLLLIICQMLIITGIAFALAQPMLQGVEPAADEKIIILDASADMLSAVSNGAENRFERAVKKIQQEIEELGRKNGLVTVIIASDEPYFLLQRAGSDASALINEKLGSLTDEADYQCTYGIANIDGAMKLAETVLEVNPEAEVMLYTGTTYTDAGNVTVVDVTDINEWNAAILKAEAVVVENYYDFRIDLASYGRDSSVNVYIDIYGVNDANEVLNFSEHVLCTQEMGTVTLTIGNDEERSQTEQNYVYAGIYSYDYAYIYIDSKDSLECDNTIYLYGGTKPELKIQYYSTLPNQFYASALRALRDVLDDRWDITLKEVRGMPPMNEEPALEGYDVYIFENTMPKILPTDGLVILANPDTAPSGAGFYLGKEMVSPGGYEVFLTGGDEPSPLLTGIDPERISLTRFTQITMFDGGYVPLLYCDGTPVALASNEADEKIVVLSFSLHYSNLPVIKEFPMLMYNLLNTYVPCTITDHLYEVSDHVDLNSRSPELVVSGPGVDTVLTEFPNGMQVTEPGVYTLTQTPISGVQVVESFYVKIPAVESNIRLVEDTLTNPYMERVEEITDIDLVFYLAMALIALLFFEWWLQSKEYF